MNRYKVGSGFSRIRSNFVLTVDGNCSGPSLGSIIDVVEEACLKLTT